MTGLACQIRLLDRIESDQILAIQSRITDWIELYFPGFESDPDLCLGLFIHPSKSVKEIL